MPTPFFQRSVATRILSFLRPAVICSGIFLNFSLGLGQADPYIPPEKAAFDARAVQYGKQICDQMKAGTDNFDTLLDATYYDGQRTYQLLSAYLKDPKWDECALAARAIYRDRYVLPNSGKLPGWYTFTEGLYYDPDQASRTALVQMADNAAYCQSSASADKDLPDVAYSREAAYCLLANINAETATGASREARIAQLTAFSLGHIDRWFVAKTAPYVRPFIVGLTGYSLVRAYERRPDPKILDALKLAAGSLWDSCWLPDSSAFKYTDRVDPLGSGGTEPAPDLNMIMSSLYAWLYRQTLDEQYRQKAEAIFAGGVRQADLARGKRFSQNYRFGLYTVAWISDARPSPSPTPAPTIRPTTSPNPTSTPRPTATATISSCAKDPIPSGSQCTNWYLREIVKALQAH